MVFLFCVLASQLAVTVGPGERRIGPGEPLELLCNVSGALPPQGRHAAYSVGWEMAPAGAPGPGRLVAQLDTEGVGSLGPGYEGRHIAMEKVASRTYRLRLEAARPGDAGTYRCLAKAYVRGSGTRLREAASARSRPLPVHVREEGERDWNLVGFQACRTLSVSVSPSPSPPAASMPVACFIRIGGLA